MYCGIKKRITKIRLNGHLSFNNCRPIVYPSNETENLPKNRPDYLQRGQKGCKTKLRNISNASPVHLLRPVIARLSEQNNRSNALSRRHDSTMLIINLSLGGLIARFGARLEDFLDRDRPAARYLHLRRRSALRIETFLSGRYGR